MSVKLFERPGTESPLRREFWKELNLPVEWLDAESNQANGVLIDAENSEFVLTDLRHIPREVLLVRHVDFIERDGQKLWPRSLLTQSLRQIVLRRAKSLDLRAWGLVTGVSPAARAALVSVFDLGYRQVRLVHNEPEEEAAQVLKADFEKFCFGLHIELQRRGELTLQPNNGSILVNVCDLKADADLLQTLLYLNFIHRPGLIVDLSATEVEGALLKEGQISGFDTVAGFEAQAEWDYSLLHLLKIPVGLSVNEYHQRWREKINGVAAVQS